MKINGPAGDLILTPATSGTQITNLIQGTYTYRLTVTDNNDNTNTDDVVITVAPVITSGAPTLFIDWSTITLPAGGLPDGTRFANDKLRSNVAYDSYSQKLIGDKMHIIVDSSVPVDPAISSAQYHYRSEFSEWPWNINLSEGTEQWVGWSYYFATDYVRGVTPISIFQNHAASSHPYPAFQLELTRPGQLPGALGGELQVINECSSPTVRKLTTVRPNRVIAWILFVTWCTRETTTACWSFGSTVCKFTVKWQVQFIRLLKIGEEIISGESITTCGLILQTYC